MNFKKLQRDIEETEHAGTKRRMIADARAAVSGWIGELQAELKRLEDQVEATRKSEISRPANAPLKRAFAILAVLLVLADGALQTIVNHIAFATMSISIVVLASISIAVALASVTHAAAYAGTFDWRRPMRSVRLCRNFAAGLGAIAAGALTLLFVSRVAAPSWVLLLSQLVPPALWIASETLPIVGGLVWTAASILAYPEKLRRSVHRLEMSLQEAKHFLDWLDEEEGTLPDAETTSGPSDKKGPVAISSAISGAILIMALGPWRAIASAQPRHVAVSTRPSVCQSYLDGSTSVDPIYRARAVDRLVRSLPDFVQAFGCDELVAGSFFSGGEFTQRHILRAPRPPDKIDCLKAKPIIQDRTMAAFSSVLAGFSTFYRDRAQQECRATLTSSEKNYFTGIRKLQKQASAVFTAPFPKGTCTDLRGLLRGAMVTPGPVIVITDAAETCSTSPAKFSPHPNGRVIFILVPSTGPIDTSGPEAIHRAEAWRRILPGLQILPFTEVSPAMWTGLGDGRR